MTKEEIRQEAEEKVNICTPYHTGSFIQGYLAGAEPREKRIEELEQQIEKMKCCGNCSHFKLDNSGLYPIKVCELIYPNRCKNHDKWELED